ncbi:MAG: TM0106 family RecB-like putative nuclease [Cyanobacteria bacterium P01_A01_bin.123]
MSNISVITSEIFVAYSQCPRKAFLLMFSEDKGEPHNYPLILEERRENNRSQYLEKFLEYHPEARAYDTKGFKKHEFLVDATLRSEQLEAYCAVLTKVDTSSTNRRIRYEPTIVTGTCSITSEQKVELLFVGLVLGQIQKQVPALGRIVGMDGKAHRVQLENGYKGIKTSLKMLESWCNAQSTETPSLVLNKHCPSCQFQHICQEQAEKENNLSLLDRMTPKAIQKYNSRGIFTVQQLSYLFRPRRRRKKQKTSEPVKHSLELQALAIREQKVYIQELPKLTRQSVELFLDIEGIPDKRFYYLMGLLVCEGENCIQKSFWTDTPEHEETIWKQLLAKINEYPEVPIYHYGNYEVKAINQLAKRYSTDIDQITKRLININSCIYGKIYFPTFSNSLKEIANSIGFSWSESGVSGLQSLAWRYQWEKSHHEKLKQKLIEYNLEDCFALQHVFNFMLKLSNKENRPDSSEVVDANKTSDNSNFLFKKNDFVLEELNYINKCAYFDYQREKIFFRNKKERGSNKNANKKLKRVRQDHKVNKYVELALPSKCPKCGHTKIYRGGRVHKTVIDLKYFKYGIKKWTTKFSTHRAWCQSCKYRWRSDEFKAIKNRYGHRVYAYMVYQRVAMKQSQNDIYENLKDIFGFYIFPGWDKSMISMANDYSKTYDLILEKLNAGKLIHADETTVDIQREEGYVWVFTSFEEVFYIYSPSREGKILGKIANFDGVLISDFYSAYNSVKCLQQKCLIHLIRDMNDDLYKNPFDEEYKTLVKNLGILLKMIVETIDEYGLKKRNLKKHKYDVDNFYKKMESFSFGSDLFEKYKSRLIKNRIKLFEFLNHDDIPWNNNNAEHAIKAFASYRNIVGGRFTENGVKRYLVLLSIYQTCKYKNVSFLDFLFSGETDIDRFKRYRRSHFC